MASLRRLVVLAALLLIVAPAHAKELAPDALARAAAGKLHDRASGAAIAPETHTTDFGDDAIGCITLTRWELADFGYPGHAFFCEEGATEEILGAVLNRSGRVQCYISGRHVGDGCYEFDICGIPETACVQ